MNPTDKPKVPRTPPEPLRRERGDVLTVTARLWRIHRTRGVHVIPWNALRRYGPLPSMRFDPHPPPLGEHDEGVLYAATSLTTALAETFQTTRLIDTVQALGQPHRPGAVRCRDPGDDRVQGRVCQRTGELGGARQRGDGGVPQRHVGLAGHGRRHPQAIEITPGGPDRTRPSPAHGSRCRTQRVGGLVA